MSRREAVRPLLALGGPDADLEADGLDRAADEIAAWIASTGARRILLVPPDQTRLHSKAGSIVAALDRRLSSAGLGADVMPALGTHRAMGPDDARAMFGDAIPAGRLLQHRWRDDVVEIGAIAAEEVDEIAGAQLGLPLPFAVNRALVDGSYELVVAVGQVVPHEVAGFGGYTKHVTIGLGGAQTIQRSHFVGAVYGIEETMGRADSPVRRLLDLGFDRFLAPRCRVLFVLTVVESAAAGPTLRGLFAGEGGGGMPGAAAFGLAAQLAAQVNVTALPAPIERCVAHLNPVEFRSTWLGNKAVYRTRLALADGGELIVVAPGVERFGKDAAVDELIRRHGYRGRDASLAAMDADPALAANLAAVAHLMHGSSEGRFTVTYCPGPGLTRSDVEGVGYRYLPLEEALARFPLEAGGDGHRLDAAGEPYYSIANPGLGLWRTA